MHADAARGRDGDGLEDMHSKLLTHLVTNSFLNCCRDINEGTYSPAASIYTLPEQKDGATVTFNFGMQEPSHCCCVCCPVIAPLAVDILSPETPIIFCASMPWHMTCCDVKPNSRCV